MIMPSDSSLSLQEARTHRRARRRTSKNLSSRRTCAPTTLVGATLTVLIFLASSSHNGSYHHCVVDSAAIYAVPAKRKSVSLQNLQTKSQHSSLPDHWKMSRGGASTASAVVAVPSQAALDMKLGASIIKAVGVAAILACTSLKDSVKGIGKGLKDNVDNFKFLVAGAVAGIVSRTAVSPLEVVATLQMVQQGVVKQPIFAQLQTLYQQEGMKGFFKGNGANCLKVAPTRAIQFFCFEALKTKLIQYKLTQKQKKASLAAAAAAASGDSAAAAVSADEVSLSPIERLVAGGMAGMVASSLVYPLEVVKTLLTLYPQQYPSIGAAFAGCWQTAGLTGFYRGLKPTLLAMFPYVGVEFMIYETSKIALEAFLTKRQKARMDGGGEGGGGIADFAPVALPIIVSLGLGAIAGAAAQTAAHPLDVVRKRLQVQGFGSSKVMYKGSWDCFQKIGSAEGVGALYRGLRPACVATIPGTGIAYITYEVMKKVLGLNSV